MNAEIDLDRQYLKTATLLYVEDDATTRVLLKTYLARRLGRVVDASDGVEGLARFAAERPQIVLTDIQMPNLDGLGMIAELRRIAPEVTVLVCTAFEEVGYLRRAIDLGVERYVTKPVDGPTLDATLLAVARRLRGAEALERERRRALDVLEERHLEAIGLLAGGLAHDFNNLLQAIYGGVSLAQDLAPPRGELRALLAGVLTSAQQARDLGRDLLVLAREPLHRRRAKIAAIVEESLRDALAGSAVRLDVTLPAELPAIELEHGLLGRAFGEIARNAREAMRDQGALHVRGESATVAEGEVTALAPGRYVVVTLRDEGPGIPAEVLPRVFDPYFSTKERGATKGTGLGLAVCRAILRKHHGHVAASCAPEGGACVRVWLPIETGEGSPSRG